MTHADLLVVDDDDATRRGLSQLLANAGFTVDDASDGAEALNKINSNNYSVVLLDIQLPGIGGLDILAPRRLYALPARRLGVLTTRRLNVLAAGARLRARVGFQGGLGRLDLGALLCGGCRRRAEHHETGERDDRWHELVHGIPPLAVVSAVLH